VRATLATAIDFGTWRSLVRGAGMRRDVAIELIVSWMKAAAD
jgi:hypothetical protein